MQLRENNSQLRKSTHSSRMCTARLLTLLGGGGSTKSRKGGLPTIGGGGWCLHPGGSAQPRGVCIQEGLPNLGGLHLGDLSNPGGLHLGDLSNPGGLHLGGSV